MLQTSPYYLGSGDQPGNLITHVILTGDNYSTWARAITLSLKARRKYGFINGTLTKPKDKILVLDWETVNSMLVSWILRSIDPKLVGTIPFHEEAKRLWDYLEKRFFVANGPRLQQLRAFIVNCKQGKTQSLEDYYSKLINLYDDLARLKPLHSCECGGCTCNVAEQYARDGAEEMLHQFFISDDDEAYGGVRSNLLSQNPIPDLDRAYQAFLQEERMRGIKKENLEKIESHIFAVQGLSLKGTFDRRGEKAKLHCSHCKKTGHNMSTCFKLHGTPSWWVKKFGVSKAGARATHGSAGVAETHVAAAEGGGARGRGSGGLVRANAIFGCAPTAGGTTSDSQATGAPVVGGDSHGSGGGALTAVLTQEQVQALLKLVNDQPPERMMGMCSVLSWILDTGASNHVTSNHSCLRNMCDVSYPLGLLDGHTGGCYQDGAGGTRWGFYS